MNAFEYASPSTVQEAVDLLSNKWGETEVLAGGTDLVTSLKQVVTAPNRVVSLKNVSGLSGLTTKDNKIHVGAMTTLAELAADSNVRTHFPALVTAVESIGSPQMVNIGTVGGELLQRPRCWYFRQGFGLLGEDDGKSLIPDGDNRYHAIFENKGPAYFVNPSSLAPGLIALDAELVIAGNGGTRTAKAADFFTVPKKDTDREYAIQPNEILTAIVIPMQGLRNATYEIRPRRGLDWPMVTASVAYEGNGGKAKNSRVVLGHVAPVPYVAAKAAKALDGSDVSSEQDLKKVGEAAADGAKPLSQNGYKVHQVKVAVRRAIQAASA